MTSKKNALNASKLYVIFGPRDLRNQGMGKRSLDDVVTQALDGGVDILQLRCKDETRDEIMEAAAIFRKRTQQYNALFIVNDNPHLALETAADGVHVGQDDMPVGEVRQIVGDSFLVGKSTHSLKQAVEAQSEAVDYLGFGPIFATPTKPDYIAVGLAPLTRVQRALIKPFFAIGGIDLANAAQVLDHGAERLAIVRAIVGAPDVESASRQFKEMLQKVPSP